MHRVLQTLVFLSVALFATSAAFACPGSGPEKAALPQKTAAKDIVDTAVKAGNFKTLVTAVKAAGLVKTLKSKGHFTVFAPTDAAFARLPKGTIKALLKNKKKLTSILTYHVVAGKLLAKDIVKRKSAKTVNGKKASITLSKGRVLIAGARVTVTDIKCSNGVIHVIDAVMLPPAAHKKISRR